MSSKSSGQKPFQDGKPVGGDHLQLSSGGLLLTRVNTSDAGDYTCRADNEQDSKEVSATIIVKRESHTLQS